MRGTRPQQSPDLGLEYSEGFVLNAPADLAEGDYLVVFDRHTLPATKERGLWLSSCAIPARAELTWPGCL